MKRLVLAFAALLFSAPAAAQAPLVADLSEHLVAITTGFTGSKVLLFGAVDGPGDVVVVVRGPPRLEKVRRKERIAGIWMNRASAEIANTPSFYRLASTKPPEQIMPAPVLERHRIGYDRLDLEIKADKGENPVEFRDALVRLKQSRQLYGSKLAPVVFLGNRLFRTEMFFPANVPVGIYSVEVYLVRNGDVVSAQTTPLTVSKAGVGAEVYDFAHQRSELYGIMAVALAAAAGWLAATAFKKG